jgi:hypothetical protein
MGRARLTVMGLTSLLTALREDLMWNGTEHFSRCIHYRVNAYIQLLHSALDPVSRALNSVRLSFVEPVKAADTNTEASASPNEPH